MLLNHEGHASRGLRPLQPVTPQRRLARIVIIFTAVTALCGFMDATGSSGFDWLEQYVGKVRTKWHIRQHPVGPVGQKITLITFSDDTFSEHNPLRIQGPPIPRHVHAQLVRNLTRAGAKLIAFDMIFDVPHKAEDDALKQAVLEAEKQPHGPKILWASLLAGDRPMMESAALHPVLPNAELLHASHQHGHIMVPHDPEHPDIAYLKAFESYEGHPVPAFSLKAALMVKGLDGQPMRREGKSWRIGNYAIPVDENGNFEINYSGALATAGGPVFQAASESDAGARIEAGTDPRPQIEKAFTTIPYEQVCDPGESALFYRDFFKDKIVLIGSSTKVDNDMQHTPAGNMYGVELHAHALNTLLQQKFVQVAPMWANWLVIGLLVGLVCPLALARRTVWIMVAVALLITVYFMANFLIFDAGLMLHLVGPVAAMVLATLGVLVDRGLIEERERNRMFDSLVVAAASAIEVRDPTTFGHSQRVAALTIGLAEAVNNARQGRFRKQRFSTAELRELRYAAVLHDFGKIGVSEDVLLKSHRVNPLHFEAILSRLVRLADTREKELLREKLTVLTHLSSDEARRKHEAIDRALRSELESLQADIALLELANDPTRSLGEGRYFQLQKLAERLRHLSYTDFSGVSHPLLTREEQESLYIRRGTLTPEEYAQIKKHPSLSYDFLRQIPWTAELRRIPDLARSHHEKLDGSGYPQGQRASAIPLQTRMMTIADIYDALTAADRPYKKAMSQEEACAVLRAEAQQGMLDVDLIELFIAAEVYRVIEGWMIPSSHLPETPMASSPAYRPVPVSQSL